MHANSKDLAIESFSDIIKFLASNKNYDNKIALKTSERFIETYLDLLSGYNVTDDALEGMLALSKEEVANYDLDLINLDKIHFVSICKHHLLPFYGEISISYIPNQYIIGLGAIAKVIDISSKKMQLQEHLTVEIGNMIQKILCPKFLSIKIEAMHLCLAIRGARKFNSVFKTEKVYF
jgi:GTP cyclohydrolase I